MENRYLYRAKRLDNGKWIYGDLVHSVYKKYDTCVGQYGNGVGMHTVDTNTICQCTGIKDKNGKLIWENDIVNCMDAECCGYIGWNESEAGFYFNVLLEDGRFEEEHIYDYQDCIEAIGNIFDNPKLLEVQDEPVLRNVQMAQL